MNSEALDRFCKQFRADLTRHNLIPTTVGVFVGKTNRKMTQDFVMVSCSRYFESDIHLTRGGRCIPFLNGDGEIDIEPYDSSDGVGEGRFVIFTKPLAGTNHARFWMLVSDIEEFNRRLNEEGNDDREVATFPSEEEILSAATGQSHGNSGKAKAPPSVRLATGRDLASAVKNAEVQAKATAAAAVVHKDQRPEVISAGEMPTPNGKPVVHRVTPPAKRACKKPSLADVH